MSLFSLEADECFHYLLTLGIAKSCHQYLMLAMLGNLKLKSLKFACAQKCLYLCTTQVLIRVYTFSYISDPKKTLLRRKPSSFHVSETLCIPGKVSIFDLVM